MQIDRTNPTIPRFEIFRKLYFILLAKPAELVYLNRFKTPELHLPFKNPCGTAFCVLGELAMMPEAHAIGISWNEEEECAPAVDGQIHDGIDALKRLGVGAYRDLSLFATLNIEEIEEYKAEHGVLSPSFDEGSSSIIESIHYYDLFSSNPQVHKWAALRRIEKLFEFYKEPLHLPEQVQVEDATPAYVGQG